MKYEDARTQLSHALNNQKTIRISKLNEILQSMNFSLHGKPQRSQDAKFLKHENRKLRQEIKKLRIGEKEE